MLFLNIKIVTQMHVTDTRPISGQGELIPRWDFVMHSVCLKVLQTHPVEILFFLSSSVHQQTLKSMFLLCSSPINQKPCLQSHLLSVSICGSKNLAHDGKREVFPVCVVYFKVNYFVHIIQKPDIVDVFLPAILLSLWF